MTTAAISSVGTIFKRAGAALAEIVSIRNDDMERETLDVTTLDSTGGYREFEGSFRNGGTYVLEMLYVKDQYGQFLIDFEAAATVAYSLILNDTGASQIDFDGLVTRLGINVAVGEVVSMPVTIKVSGGPTLTS